MKQKSSFTSVFLLIFVLVSFLAGCGSTPKKTSNTPDTKRVTNAVFLSPEASGASVSENDLASFDSSNIHYGYFMAKYNGASSDAKLQVKIPDGTTYTYALSVGNYETIPLTGGDGDYHMDILEHVHDDMYALVLSENISVSLENEFSPYLYPNQYVWYTPDSETTALGITISDESANDLDFLEKVYHYVTSNIS